MPAIAYSYVRFSSVEQAKGGSYHRQLAAAQKYAQANGLVLDSTTVFDRGVSAFKGMNRTTGALAGFLSRIDRGEIKPGSYLLIENLDRISREEVDSAQETIKKILRAGIIVVTLMDGRVYDKKSINDPFALIQMILIGARAHEESETKSRRSAEAWRKKRGAAATGDILSTRLPYWLELKDGKIIPIADKALLVQRIYAMAKDGYGYTKIIRELNQQGIAAPRGKTWAISTVQGLLHNRAVIGECQPYKMTGKGYGRLPDGPPIPHYFPAVIAEGDFFAVQARQGVRGPMVKKAHHLFSGLVYCGMCGAKMMYKRISGYGYLCCTTAVKGAGCHYVGIQYKDAEEIVLDQCAQKLEIKQARNDVDTEIAAIKERIRTAELVVKEKEKQLQNLMLSFAGSTGTLRENYDNLVKTVTGDIDGMKKVLEVDRPLLMQRQQARTGIKGKLQLVVDIAAMRTKAEARIQLREAIRDVIDKVTIYPAGAVITTTAEGDKLVADLPKPNANVLRVYQICYRDGTEALTMQSLKLSHKTPKVAAK
jgi:DNA invertase Pin-like site-specific DNA recombinase